MYNLLKAARHKTATPVDNGQHHHHQVRAKIHSHTHTHINILIFIMHDTLSVKFSTNEQCVFSHLLDRHTVPRGVAAEEFLRPQHPPFVSFVSPLFFFSNGSSQNKTSTAQCTFCNAHFLFFLLFSVCTSKETSSCTHMHQVTSPTQAFAFQWTPAVCTPNTHKLNYSFALPAPSPTLLLWSSVVYYYYFSSHFLLHRPPLCVPRFPAFSHSPRGYEFSRSRGGAPGKRTNVCMPDLHDDRTNAT